jgi:hypothetical protein
VTKKGFTALTPAVQEQELWLSFQRCIQAQSLGKLSNSKELFQALTFFWCIQAGSSVMNYFYLFTDILVKFYFSLEPVL